ncbi:MAG TPA: zf-HC2 domain-containing protein [Fimbriimonadaceae bacterium]|nr:zf-HC2 domain-containing protein [Fimbriimonadaceae bacterium]
MNKPDKYDCQEAFDRLDDYIDRELSEEEISLLEAHLCECVHCANAYKFEGKVTDCIKKKIAHLAIPQGLLERVNKALDDCDCE